MMLAGGRLPGVLRHPDPPLSDGVITLRSMTGADADAVTAACQDPEIPRWTRVPVPYRRADALAWIAGSELELDAGISIHWVAVDSEDRLLASGWSSTSTASQPIVTPASSSSSEPATQASASARR